MTAHSILTYVKIFTPPLTGLTEDLFWFVICTFLLLFIFPRWNYSWGSRESWRNCSYSETSVNSLQKITFDTHNYYNHDIPSIWHMIVTVDTILPYSTNLIIFYISRCYLHHICHICLTFPLFWRSKLTLARSSMVTWTVPAFLTMSWPTSGTATTRRDPSHPASRTRTRPRRATRVAHRGAPHGALVRPWLARFLGGTKAEALGRSCTMHSVSYVKRKDMFLFVGVRCYRGSVRLRGC